MACGLIIITIMFFNNPIESLVENANLSSHNKEVVLYHLFTYFCDMHKVELDYIKQHDAKPNDDKLTEDNIKKQRKVYNKYWQREDQYWEPCSVGNTIHYDLQQVNEVKVLEDGEDNFLVVFKYGKDESAYGSGTKAYQISTFKGKPKIVNQYF